MRSNSAGPLVPSANNPMNNGPKLTTPTLIPPLKYIVYNNPQEVYNLLVNLGYKVKNSIPSTYEFAKFYIRDRGESAVLDIVRAAHPDKDLLFKAFGVKEKESSSYTETPAATTMPVANPATTAAPTPEKSQGFKINSQSLIIILIVIIFIVLVTRK